MNAEDALDAALARIAHLSPEYGGELSDHSPMVVEALARLGAPEAIDAYLTAVLPKRRPLSEERAEQLSRFGSLAAEATGDVQRLGVAGALERWLPRLLEGFSGAAFHGSIRVGHAVRSLSRRDTEARRAELGRALAYTTLRSEPLPAAIAGERAPLDLGEALRAILPSPEAMVARSPGLISTALAERAGSHSRLASTAGSLSEPADPHQGLRELLSASIDLLLRGEYLPQATFTMLHGVTGLEAAVAIAAHLDRAAALALWRAAAHALLALRISFVGAYPAHPPRPAGRSRGEGVALAVRALDDHAIKLAAALTGAEGTVPEPHLAAALDLWVGRFA